MEEGVGNGEVAAYADSMCRLATGPVIAVIVPSDSHIRIGAPAAPPPPLHPRRAHTERNAQRALTATRWCRERERICAGFRKQLPTILAT